MCRALLVLVAEDDAALRYLAQRQLTALGFQCEIVTNGAEALEKVANHRYDLILMDVQMPVMNGIEATIAIRQHEQDINQDTSTPIVAMTANPKKDQCYEAGMNDFMFKPISLDQMRQTIMRWVA